jgi:hypothetical protein
MGLSSISLLSETFQSKEKEKMNARTVTILAGQLLRNVSSAIMVLSARIRITEELPAYQIILLPYARVRRQTIHPANPFTKEKRFHEKFHNYNRCRFHSRGFTLARYLCSYLGTMGSDTSDNCIVFEIPKKIAIIFFIKKPSYS